MTCVRCGKNLEALAPLAGDRPCVNPEHHADHDDPTCRACCWKLYADHAPNPPERRRKRARS